MSRRRPRPADRVAALTRRPWIGAVLVALASAASLPLLAGLGVDNSLEVWLPPDAVEQREYRVFLEEFGSEEYVLLVYPLTIPLADGFLERLVDLRFELEEIDGVRGVYDLSTIYSRFFALAGREAFEADLTSPFYRGFMVSRERDLAATWVLLDLEAAGERGALVASIEEAARLAGFGDELWLAGSPVLNAELDRASTAAAATFYPLVLAASALMLLVTFRRIAGIVIPLVSVGCGLIWTLALMVLTGHSLDMVTVTLPPVVGVVGLATSIHLLAHSQRRLRQGEDSSTALATTLRELVRPCGMSAATSALGFAALTTSSMPPVREMGAFAALGVLLCLISNFLLFPWLGRWWGRGAGRWKETSRVAGWMTRLGRWVTSRPGLVLVAGGLATLAALLGIARLRADSNVIEFFDDETEIARTYERILPDLTGPYSMEILVEAGEDWRRLESMRRLEELARAVEERPGVARVLSITDFVKRAAAPVGGGATGDRLPGSEVELEDAWRRVDEHLSAEVGPLVGGGGTMRLSVIALPMSSAEHRELVEGLEDLLAGERYRDLEPRLTGVVSLLVALQDELVASQVRSFSLAFLVILPVIGLFFRSARYALLALPPNLVPILLTLGFMGWVGVALDPATVMIAAIAFGIVVDDSIHFLSFYRERRRSGEAAVEAAIATLAGVGRPLWITSIVVALGFSVLCFSSFLPLYDFGRLSAGAMLAALAGNLVLLPALLVRFDARRG